MINCNPETVSTDYDTSDRLYFEPLTAEDVLEVLHREASNGELVGVIVQFGGQTPLNLASALKAAGIPILGTSPDNIDLAEDRERFAALVRDLGLRQPNNGIATSREQAADIAARVGYPVLMRPSFVLGGRAMEVVETPAQLDAYLRDNAAALSGGPVLIDQYLRDAVEVDVDALADADTRVRRRRPPAYRGGRGAIRRQRLLDPAALAQPGNHRRDRAADGAARPRARCPRPDEHPVRGQGRRRST